MRLEIYSSDKLNFVELNITGDNDNYITCDTESKFIDTELFNLFASCFEKANKLYEYFGAIRFNSRQIIPLRNALKENLESLEKINTEELFTEYIGSVFLGTAFILELEKQDKSWSPNWDHYLVKIKKANADLISLVDQCIDEGRVLWVIGN